MVLSESDTVIQNRINATLPLLNERGRRIYLGAESLSLGRGGIKKIHQLSGANCQTIASGMKEVKQESVSEQPKIQQGRIRKEGGGRKKEVEKHPQILLEIMDIILPHTMGDPEKPLIWCSKSTRKIQKTLRDRGYPISHESIRKCLKSLGFSLQSNKKTKEGGNHPDRDAQFEHINTTAQDFLSAGDPVISVDCKKKELIRIISKNRQWAKVIDFLKKPHWAKCA